MDDMKYKAMIRRIAALEARVAILEKGGPAEQASSKKIDALLAVYPVDMDKTRAAKELGVTRATVYAMLSDGRLQENGRGRVITQSLVRLMTGPMAKKYGGRFEDKGG